MNRVHPNAEAHAKLMAWLEAASAEEVLELSKRAGIYNRHGELEEAYGGQPRNDIRLKRPNKR